LDDLAIAFVIWLVLVTLFTPRIDYRVSAPLRPDSDAFLHVIQVTCQAAVHYHNRVEILTNGAQFVPRHARRHSEAKASSQHGGVHLSGLARLPTC